MEISQIQEAAIKIANEVLGKERDKSKNYEPCTKQEIEKIIGMPGYYSMIKESILAVGRISTNKGAKKKGGLVREYVENSQKELTIVEKETIKEKIIELFNRQSQIIREKPEWLVETAFYEWKKSNLDARNSDNNIEIFSIRSSKRTGKEWENVDLYEVRFEECIYHISFKPILISFEVKAAFPDQKGLSQAKNYLKFSHQSYLVFKDGRSGDQIRKELESMDLDGLGVYHTQDGIEFTEIYKAQTNLSLTDSIVDLHLHRLLIDKDKQKLLDLRRKYIKKHIIDAL